MKAEAFLQAVERSMPDRAELAARGLDDDGIREIQSMFVATRRGTTAPTDANELERMIIEFDCSTLEVGLVRFNERLERQALGECFAYCEADALVIAEDRRVGLVDHAAPQRVHQFCAASPEQFLDALALVVNRAKGESNVEMLTDCSNAAGGAEYADFYRVFCSIDS